MVDKLIKDIKKDKLNAENVLLNNSLFVQFKKSLPDVDSSSNHEESVESGIDVVNSPLNTSSIGGATDIMNNNSSSEDDSSSSEKINEDKKEDKKEDTETDDLLDLDELSTVAEYSND